MATGKKLSGLTTIESLEDDDLIYVVRPSEWAGERSKGITKQDFVSGITGTGAVDSVNTQTGAVVLDADDIDDSATTNKFTTAADASKLSGIETGATADQTGAEIKSLYEAEADTNAFTDTLLSKINSITAIFTTALKSAYDSASSWVTTNGTNVVNHLSNTSNPHSVTKAQVGLTSADDTSDADKPISTATQTALDAKQATLVSATNIKTVNGTTLLGSGDLTVSAGDVEGTEVLSTGETGGSKFLREDGDGTCSWQAIGGGGDMLAANNLSDLASAATSRTNLGVDVAGTDNSTDVTLAGTGTYISIAGQVITVDPITESDISDLGTYSTDIHANITALDNVSGTNTGDQTSIVGITGTKAQFDSAVTDGNIMYVGDAPTAHNQNASTIDIVDSGALITATDVEGALAENRTAINLNTAKNTYPSGDATKVGHLTVTQAVDLDTIESNVATNNAKVGVTTQISNIVEDTTPQLGGNLDLNGNVITGLQIGTDVQAYSTVLQNTTASFLTADETKLDGIEAGAEVNDTVCISFAISDETTDLTTGTTKATFRMPFALTLTDVRASVSTAPTGSTLIVDINETATTILSTKLSIDAGEKTSATATSAVVISDTALADDAEITFDIDQVGSTVAGAGLKIYLIGNR